MPMRKTKSTKRRGAKKTVPRRRARVPRPPRRNFDQPEWASCTEVVRPAPLETNAMYGNNGLVLTKFKRASAIAGSYQQYRITGITWRFTPRFDTFPVTTDATTQQCVPYFYYMIDRLGTIRTTVTLAQLQSMGATPKRFDDKSIVVKYKPGVGLAAGSDTAPGLVLPAKATLSPWLDTMDQDDAAATNLSSINHLGLWFILDTKSLPGDGQYEYDVDIEVNFQFRKPMISTPTGANDRYFGSVFSPVQA